MDKRLRSPNYPALSLPDAIEKVTALYRLQHTHSAPREVAVKSMGYNSLNGASATAISALHKYGLLERIGDEVKISDRAMRILHPHSPEERAQAVNEAAYEPPLFAELRERFPGQMPSDDLLRNYLVRKGFAPGALTAVMSAYRETSEIAAREERLHDSLREQPQEPDMPQQALTLDQTRYALPAQTAAAPPQTPVIAMMEDHFIVNMVVRSRSKAKALRHMIEMVENLLPEDDSAKETRGSETVKKTAVSGEEVGEMEI